MKSKSKVVAIPALNGGSRPRSPLPPPLVAAMFAEAGIEARAGRPETISATLGPAVDRFRKLAQKLSFEREPGLFPVPDAAPMKKARLRK